MESKHIGVKSFLNSPLGGFQSTQYSTILCTVSCKRGVGTWYEICPRVFVEEAKNKGKKTRSKAVCYCNFLVSSYHFILFSEEPPSFGDMEKLHALSVMCQLTFSLYGSGVLVMYRVHFFSGQQFL